jgi:hypothetical protein
MVQLKKGSLKSPQLSNAIQKPKAGQKKVSAALKTRTALADVQRCKEHGIEIHLQAKNTRTNYAGHVRRGQEWLASHFDKPSKNTSKDSDPPDDNDVYDDPAFKGAFSHIPNRCSDKALALYMSLKGFHENLSKTTVESIRAAFKKLWERS